MDHPVYTELRTGVAHVFEEASPTAEQHRRQRDFKLIDDVHVQVLLDHIRTTRDPDITITRGFPGKRKGTLRAF